MDASLAAGLQAHDALFAAELKKYDALIADIHQNVATQAQVLATVEHENKVGWHGFVEHLFKVLGGTAL